MSDSSGIDRLTPEERDVLRLVTEGLSQRAISDRLSISYAAVASNISVILDRLGVRTRLDAAARQVRFDGLRDDLRQLSRRSRDLLVRWLVADQSGRDDPAAQALKRRAEADDSLAEFIRKVAHHPEERLLVIRLLREIEAEEG